MASGSSTLRFETTHENYSSAARRHLHDARTLLDAGRSDNAAYLAGYVIECSLKKLLEIHGHGAREYSHDIQRMSGRALSLAAVLSPGATRYRIDVIPELQEVVSFWRSDQRYLPTGAIVGGATLVQVATQIYEQIMVEAILDGNGALHP